MLWGWSLAQCFTAKDFGSRLRSSEVCSFVRSYRVLLVSPMYLPGALLPESKHCVQVARYTMLPFLHFDFLSVVRQGWQFGRLQSIFSIFLSNSLPSWIPPFSISFVLYPVALANLGSTLAISLISTEPTVFGIWRTVVNGIPLTGRCNCRLPLHTPRSSFRQAWALLDCPSVRFLCQLDFARHLSICLSASL